MTESERISELWKEHFPEFSINGNMFTIFHQALTEFAEWHGDYYRSHMKDDVNKLFENNAGK
jgi:hypothetical protein